MDQITRNKLRSAVTQCRRRLEESIAQQLQGRYDIYATGKKDEVRAEKDVPLEHLGDEERQARRDILAHYEHIMALGYKPREALEQLVREIAFTHLNRLCAYKMMEVRDVYVGGQRFREAVSKGLKSQGFLFYLADHPEDERRFNAGQQEEAYRHFLNWLGGTLSQEIGVLFSPTDPANRVYPPQRVLDEVLDLLNSEELKGIWSEDETIGWVYQYFTPKELRDQARKESQAPRNSYELAFRNQFFTPRYVVEFLTDNTLGRIWYEMRRGNTRLKDECRYMVRRPTEVFLRDPENPLATPPRAEWVKAAARGDFSQMPDEPTIDDLSDFSLIHDGYELAERLGFGDCIEWADRQLVSFRQGGELPKSSAELWLLLFRHQRYWGRSDGRGPSNVEEWRSVFCALKAALTDRDESLSQEELLRQPVYVPHRSKKDPREIKILDPACGSGHFLLYCFALLLSIYEEAYNDVEVGTKLRADFSTQEEFKKALPGLILRHNIHGIDIDLRAAQIAGLALWLRCQRAYHEMGLKRDRPAILKANIVCAEPMPGEGDFLGKFTMELHPRALAQLVEAVFGRMKLAGEAGSLLKIDEEIRDAVAKARREWIGGSLKEQLSLFGDSQPKSLQQQFDFDGMDEKQFFEKAETRVIDSLKRFAEQSSEKDRTIQRLFAEDTARGFAFIDLASKQYDVVLTNPPFGMATEKIRSLIESHFEEGKNDLYASFVVLAMDRVRAERGYIGAITSRAFVSGRHMRRFRDFLLPPADERWTRNKLSVFIDLGQNVLDEAVVETACYVAGPSAPPFAQFLDLRRCPRSSLSETLRTQPLPFISRQTRFFDQIPMRQFYYGLSNEQVELLNSPLSFEPDVGRVTKGLSTCSDDRFVRCFWEVPQRSMYSRWFPLAKGGEYSWLTGTLHLVIDYEDQGHRLAEFNRAIGGNVARSRQSSKYYFKPAATWSRRSNKGFSARRLRAGSIFTDKSPVVVPLDHRDLGWLPIIMLSDMYHPLIEGQAKFGSYETASVKTLPLPSRSIRDSGSQWDKVYSAVDESEYGDETSWLFCSLLQSDTDPSVQITAALSQVDEILAQHGLSVSPIAKALILEDTKKLEWNIHKNRVSCTLGYVFGRWDARILLGVISPAYPSGPFDALPGCQPGSLLGPDGLPALETPAGYPIRIDWDGILVDDPDHSDDIIRRVRDVFEVIWKDKADAIEKEVCENLGVPDLRDYFRKPGAGGYWDDHLSRYTKSRRKAPIYWLLQSSKKNYALWIYYHRLDKDILFKALLNYVEPKIRKEEARLGELRSQKAALDPAAKGAKKMDKDIDRQEGFLSELRDFEDKLRRAANLHLEPDLNDGVVLNIAPLHELVPWKEAKKYWEDLMDGKYEWSSIGKQLREKRRVK